MSRYPVCEEGYRIVRLSSCDMEKVEKQLIQLRDLERMMEQAVQEAEKAESDHAFWKGMVVGASLVVVACDVVVGALGMLTGPAGTVVAKAYDGSKLLVDAVNGNVTTETGVKLLVNNKASITEMTLNATKHATAGNVVGGATTIANAGYDLYKIIDEASVDGAAGIRSAKRSAVAQLQRIRAQMRGLQADLDACMAESAPLP